MGAQKVELRIRQIIPKWASVHISPTSKLQVPVSQLEATWQSQLHLLNQFNATNLPKKKKKKKCCPAEPLRNPSSLKEGKTLLPLGVPLQNTWLWFSPEHCPSQEGQRRQQTPVPIWTTGTLDGQPIGKEAQGSPSSPHHLLMSC